MSRLSPKRIRIKTEMFLKKSADNPVAETIADKNRVKKVKLKTKPIIIPRGFLFPPPTVPDKTTGKIGRIQGERIVTTPPKKAKRISNGIFYRVLLISSSVPPPFHFFISFPSSSTRTKVCW